MIEYELGRPATRAELHAARRAAHRLAEDGHCQLRYVEARRGGEGRRSKMLLVGRVGMSEIDWPDHSAVALAANTFPTPTPSASTHALSQLITAVEVASQWAKHVDLDGLDPEEASDAVMQISKPVRALYLLRRELKSVRRLRTERGNLSGCFGGDHVRRRPPAGRRSLSCSHEVPLRSPLDSASRVFR